jgi:hypothetical protein
MKVAPKTALSKSLRLLCRSLAWLAATALAACGHESASAPGPSTAAASSASPSSAAKPEMAPTPYTAEQLRAANRPGTTYRYKIETSGEPVQIQVMEFTSGSSAERAEVKSQTLDESGKAKSPPSVEHTAWADLRRHGEFPRAALTVEPGAVEVPAGKFEVMVYTVSAPNGDTARFHFAKSYAGPPVLVYKERAGTRLMTMTLMERKSGDSH